MNQITPYSLWIGHAGDGRDSQTLFDNGIRAVVQLAIEEPPIQPPRELIFHRFPLHDGNGNRTELLQIAITSVAMLIRRGVPTLVCCGAGMSRSPAVVAAALTMVEDTRLDDCLKRVTESHAADVSLGLLAQIEHVLPSCHV
ncbi:MAG TPA: dual specificity protein phosphatase [Thermoguttaceae bacterium]|nr:dual specificity protein phosphatase [Thermoguttaceae bacterium]